VLLGLVALLGVIAALGTLGAGAPDTPLTSQPAPEQGGSAPSSGEQESRATDVSETADKLGAVPPSEPASPHYLIRNGELSLLIAGDSLAATMDKITALAARMGGYITASGVGSSTYYGPVASSDKEGGGTQQGVKPTYGWLTVRVPQARFDAAVKQLSALGEVQSVSTSSEDVTAQYVDLEARLRHARAVELRLLRFLKDTTSIREMLAVQDRLDAAQLTIEQLEAQIRLLSETTTYGTLSVSLTEKGVPVAGQIDSSGTFLGVLKQSLTVLAQGARIAALALTAALPFLAVFAAIAVAVWYVVRLLRRRRRSLQQPPPVA
jgi:hypothetical protein